MILIISEENDISTDYFIEWCHYLGLSVLRVNESDALNILDNAFLGENDTQIMFKIKEKTICFDDIEALWFRRGYIRHYSPFQLSRGAKESNNPTYKFLKNENKTLNEFILYSLQKKYSIGSQSMYNANKLIALSISAEVGFKIPPTLITQQIAEVKSVFNHQPIITKAIQDAWLVEYDELKFSPVVNTIDENEHLEQFYYSKFQLQIDKKYELRIFFIEDKFYASAIFPKDKINSKVVENDAHYPRIIPFKLPKDIEEKLKRFNQKMNLNTGSFDIIVDEKDEYYFLEVNPVGQFDYISKLCNYNLDKVIAKHFKTVIVNEKTQ